MARLDSVSTTPPGWILPGDTVSVLLESLGERSAGPLIGSNSSLSILFVASSSWDVSMRSVAMSIAVGWCSFSDCDTGLLEISSLPHSLMLCTP